MDSPDLTVLSLEELHELEQIIQKIAPAGRGERPSPEGA